MWTICFTRDYYSLFTARMDIFLYFHKTIIVWSIVLTKCNISLFLVTSNVNKVVESSLTTMPLLISRWHAELCVTENEWSIKFYYKYCYLTVKGLTLIAFETQHLRTWETLLLFSFDGKYVLSDIEIIASTRQIRYECTWIPIYL